MVATVKPERIKPPAPDLKADERRVVLLRALWARHDLDGKERPRNG